MCIVKDARTEAMEAVMSHCENGGDAWMMAEEVAKRNGWPWVRNNVTGIEHAANTLMHEILARRVKL